MQQINVIALRMHLLLLLWDRVRTSLTLGQLEQFAHNGPEHIATWANAEIERRWHIQKHPDICFLVTAHFLVHLSNGIFLCDRHFRKYVQAPTSREAKHIFESQFTMHMARRYHVDAADIALLQIGALTMRRAALNKCEESRKRAEKKCS